MKFTAALSLAMAIGAIAEPVIVGRGTPTERDVPAITNVLNAVGSGLSALDTAVNAFSGDASAIDSAAASLISTIDTETAAVPSTGALTVADAIALAVPVQALQAVGQTLVSDLIAQKSAFEAAGLCTDLASITSGIQTSSSALINAIVALVPTAVQAVAQNLAAPFNAALAEGVAAYASGNCTDAATSTSAAPTSTAAPTSSETSSAVETTSSGSAASSSSAAQSSSASEASSSAAASSGSAASSTSAQSSAATSSVATYPAASSVATYPVASTVKTSCTSASAGTSTASTYVAGPYPTATTSGSAGTTTGATVQPTTSYPASVTGAANVNRVANSFGVIALIGAALVL